MSALGQHGTPTIPRPARRLTPVAPHSYTPPTGHIGGGVRPQGHRTIGIGPSGHPYAGPPYSSTAPPPDPNLIAQEAAARRALALGNAADAYQQAQIENEYGYGVDTSNPYSRARLLQQSYQNHMRGNTNSYASAGQLYSGALQNAQDETTRQFYISDDALRRAYQNAKDQILLGKVNRYASTLANVDQDTLNSLLKALGQ